MNDEMNMTPASEEPRVLNDLKLHELSLVSDPTLEPIEVKKLDSAVKQTPATQAKVRQRGHAQVVAKIREHRKTSRKGRDEH